MHPKQVANGAVDHGVNISLGYHTNKHVVTSRRRSGPFTPIERFGP